MIGIGIVGAVGIPALSFSINVNYNVTQIIGNSRHLWNKP